MIHVNCGHILKVEFKIKYSDKNREIRFKLELKTKYSNRRGEQIGKLIQVGVKGKIF